jgi:hypothetical protein
MAIDVFFPFVFVFASLFIVAVFGFIVFSMFRRWRRASDVSYLAQNAAGAGGNRRALEIVSRQPPTPLGHKCKQCGATVDSTAELSADGKVRCNYCNEWSTIL